MATPSLGNASTAFGCAEGPLDAIAAHRLSGGRTLFLIPPGGGKEPGGVLVGLPVNPSTESGCLQAKGRSGLWRPCLDGHEPVGAVTVDVGNLKVESFMESESQAIDGGEVDLVVHGGGCPEETPDFLDTQDGGKTVFALSANEATGYANRA